MEEGFQRHIAREGHAVLWRRLDQPGHEAARLLFHDASWHLTGVAIFAHGGRPCRLDYQVVCDAAWHTSTARVTGWVGVKPVDIALSVDSNRRWRLNGRDCPDVAGCIDVDLAFSPSTNLLPIRRLALAVGDAAPVRAAWLRFPGFTIEPLEQSYRRVGVATYRYESAGGAFVAELQVDEVGFVVRYPELWAAEP